MRRAPLARAAPILGVLAGLTVTQAVPARADDERVPLSENFGPIETAAALGATAVGVFLFTGASAVLDPPSPSMGAPHPDSLDARISRALYAGDRNGGRFLWGLPDVAGAYVIPIAPALVYGAGALLFFRAGEPVWPSADWNPHHRLLGYVEALGWTYLVTGVAKFAVGRPRPYTEGANNHPELRKRTSEDNLSFFSAHASWTFATGAFVTADVSRYLVRHVLIQATPARRFLLGTLLPYTVGYGIPTLVSLSRLVDQQHWPSDVALGALTGALVAHLVCALHFDELGRPRRRRGGLGAGRLVPSITRRPDGTGRFTLSFAARF